MACTGVNTVPRVELCIPYTIEYGRVLCCGPLGRGKSGRFEKKTFCCVISEKSLDQLEKVKSCGAKDNGLNRLVNSIKSCLFPCQAFRPMQCDNVSQANDFFWVFFNNCMILYSSLTHGLCILSSFTFLGFLVVGTIGYLLCAEMKDKVCCLLIFIPNHYDANRWYQRAFHGFRHSLLSRTETWLKWV